MAGSIDRILERSLTLVNNNGIFSERGAEKLAVRLERAEDNLDRKEEKILTRLARIEANREDLKKDKDKGKRKRKKIKDGKEDRHSTLEKHLYKEFNQIQEERATLASIREKIEASKSGPVDDSSSGNTDSRDHGSITPNEGSIVISDTAKTLLRNNTLGHSQLHLRELNRTAQQIARDGEYLERSEELLDKQIEAAEDVQHELRKGTDPDRLRKKQEELFAVMEEKYLLDDAIRNEWGLDSEEFTVAKEIFHDVPANIEFIKETEKEKRDLVDRQDQVKYQERSISKEIDAARYEISKISNIMAKSLQQAEETARLLENQIVIQPDEAKVAHSDLHPELGQLLL